MTEKDYNINFADALGERYITYAMATIMSRSLPDVRDGIKPVHRRLLYAMLKLRLDPESGFKKCARVVGDVIGKYHPHGDQAVYDALVRLAQSFAVRYPLVEGQGNFGSIDGDNAAAMRYTEAKLTRVAMLLLEDIDKDVVSFKNTYDDSDIEPLILPGKFPNLLANGSEGIAVGMATSIPPHNASEIFQALITLLENSDISVAELCHYIKAPDFPTGGVIYETKEAIIKSYQTGKGSFRVRAKWHKEDLGKGLYKIIISEIPYQVQKSRLIEKIAELYKQKKLTLLGSIQDESDADLRIVIEPKTRNIEPSLLMEQLFKFTELENKFYLNMNVLNANTKPHIMSLKQVLEEFIEHRYVVMRRKSNYLLDKIIARLEILEGYLIAYLNLDKLIAIIRDNDEPKPLIVKEFSLTDNQAEAILNMKLRSLRKLEEFKIKAERDSLREEKDFYEKLLASKALQKKELLKEFKELKKEFTKEEGDYARKTKIIHDELNASFDEKSFIESEKVTLISSKLGWLRVLNGHAQDVAKLKFKTGDKSKFIIELNSLDKILLVTMAGKFFMLDVHKLPRGRGDGQPINSILEIDNSANILQIYKYEENQEFILATKFGLGFRVSSKDLISQTKTGKQIVNLANNDKLIACAPINEGDDYVALVNSNRKMLIFKISDLPKMQKGKGVILQRQVDSELCDVRAINFVAGLSWNSGKQIRQETDLRAWLGKRSSKGNMVPFGFPKSNKFN
jgi:topoisomerase-4 subunit A